MSTSNAGEPRRKLNQKLFLVRIVFLLLALACAGPIFDQIIRYGVQVPFWDEWDFVSSYQRLETGEVPLSALFLTGAGEHLGGLQMGSIMLWRLIGMNRRLIMVLDWLLTVLFVVFISLVARQALPRGSLVPWAILSTSSFFAFHPGAYQVWLWAIPHNYTIVPLLFVAAAFCAQTRLAVGAKIVLAAVAGVIASFTLGSGMLLWFLLPVVLATYTSWRELLRHRIAIAIYGLSALVMAALYIHNLSNYIEPAPAATQPVTVRELASFFLAYTGNLVLGFPAPALVPWAHAIGAILLIFLGLSIVAAIKTNRGKREWNAIVVWLCLAAYQLAAGALVALTRHTFGVTYLMDASRYVQAASFLPVATVAIAIVAARSLRYQLPRNLLWYTGLLCMITAVLTACLVIRAGQLPGTLALLRHSYRQQLKGEVAVAAAGLLKMEEYRYVYPRDDWEAFRRLSAFLALKDWLPPLWDDRFVQSLAKSKVDPLGAAGYIDDFAVKDGKLSLRGWAYLKARQEAADAVIIIALPSSGPAKILSVAFPSQARPDVAVAVGNRNAGATGWVGEIPGSLPETGTLISAFAYDAHTGKAYSLSGGRTL